MMLVKHQINASLVILDVMNVMDLIPIIVHLVMLVITKANFSMIWYCKMGSALNNIYSKSQIVVKLPIMTRNTKNVCA